MKSLHTISFILLVLGGLNWLLHAFDYNLIEKIDAALGAGEVFSMVVYILVGVSAIYEVATHRSNCSNCRAESVPKI